MKYYFTFLVENIQFKLSEYHSITKEKYDCIISIEEKH